MLWRLVSRVVMLPVLAGIAYEYIRWTAGHIDSHLVRWLIKPNLALQHLTTRVPTTGDAGSVDRGVQCDEDA